MREIKLNPKAAQFFDTLPVAGTGNPDEFRIAGDDTIFPDDPGDGYASPVDTDALFSFVGVYIKNGKEVGRQVGAQGGKSGLKNLVTSHL